MSEPSYRILWKGRIEGPYTRAEIDRRLARGELSLLHRVEIDSAWRPLDALVAPRAGAGDPPPATSGRPVPTHTPARARGAESAATSPAGDLRVRLVYALCGTAFLLPVLATVPALLLAGDLRRRGHTGDARAQFAFATLFTALGVVFWLFVRRAHAAGHLG